LPKLKEKSIIDSTLLWYIHLSITYIQILGHIYILYCIWWVCIEFWSRDKKFVVLIKVLNELNFKDLAIIYHCGYESHSSVSTHKLEWATIENLKSACDVFMCSCRSVFPLNNMYCIWEFAQVWRKGWRRTRKWNSWMV
jgi:hypothetical protein